MVSHFPVLRTLRYSDLYAVRSIISRNLPHFSTAAQPGSPGWPNFTWQQILETGVCPSELIALTRFQEHSIQGELLLLWDDATGKVRR